MRIRYLATMMMLACMGVGCPANNSSFTPPPADYQVTTCKDLSPTVLLVNSAEDLSITTIDSTPVTIADNQVTVLNRYYSVITPDMSESASVKKSSWASETYQTALKWKQSGEDVEMKVSVACLERSPSDLSVCFDLTDGKMDSVLATYDSKSLPTLTMDVRYKTAQGQTARMMGKLLYTKLSGKVDLAEVTCQAHCETTKAGVILGTWETIVDEGGHDNSAQRTCNYTCDNAAIGSTKTKCSSDACTGEADALGSATSGIPKDLSCSTVSSDFAALPPLTVVLLTSK